MSAGGLTLDTDALIAAERSDLLMWSLHLAAVKRGRIPMVLAGVLSEAWRGGPQHQMSRFLKGCEVEDLNEAKARRLGVFVAQFGLVDTVDLAAVDGASPMSDRVLGASRPLEHPELQGNSGFGCKEMDSNHRASPEARCVLASRA
jgi:hypothetical protein